jgi:hypothetical protein
MDYRAVFLTCAIVGAGAVASTAACSAPDPQAITFSERPGSPGEPQGTSSGGSSSTSSSSGATSSSGGKAGDSGAPADAIFGTAPIKWQDPGIAANAANAAHNNTVEGKDCVQGGCHLGGAKAWLFGGTIYSAAQGGATVGKAQIKIVGPDGAEVGSAYTDANGNFWMEAQGKTIPPNSKVGVRREGGTGTKMMATPLSNTDAGCNANRANCHGTAATGKVYIP